MKKYVCIAKHAFLYPCLFLTAFWLTAVSVTAQQATTNIPASGKVLDEKGNILAGVTIQLKGSAQFATSDRNGDFFITYTNPNDSLLISFTGYQSKLLRAAEVKNVVIQLEPGGNLGEVVVVGYGTQKKLTVTGAISSISVKELQTISTPSLSNAISGRLPGIITRQAVGEPGYDAAQVYIRGLNTWGNANPLILIDGVERDMNNINAQEIESFTILKDASATAVYGVRGANGVILITTKRGKAGKPQVTFRSEYARLASMRVPKYINSGDYARLMNEARSLTGRQPRWTEKEVQKFYDGSDPYFYPNVDWTKELLKKSTGQTINNLSVSGGNNVVRYFTNVGFTLQDGIYKTDAKNKYNTNAQMKRYNFRSNIDLNLSPSLSMQLGIGGIIQHGNYPGSGSQLDIFHTIRFVPPNAIPIRNPDGSVAGSAAYGGVGLNQNPWGRLTQGGYAREDRGTIQGTFAAKWDLSRLITKGLYLAAKVSYDRFTQSNNHRPKKYAIKQYQGVDPATGKDRYALIRAESPMEYYTYNFANRAFYTEAQLGYSNSFKQHNLTGMLLFNQRDYVNLTSNNAIGNLPFRQRGLSGRTTYNYDNRYIAEFNFGYNGSENFAPGKRFGFFPSVSAGWIVSNENFWKVNAINHLKFRASRGKVGNDQVGGPRFLYLTILNPYGYSYRFGVTPQEWGGIDENITGNPNATWEVATKTNIGMDLELLNGAITLQVDAFREKRDGMLIQRQTIPAATGIPPQAIPYGNLGKTRNKGIDALLEIKHTTKKGLYYSLRGNFTYAKNTIIEMDEPEQKFAYQSQEGYSIGVPRIMIAEGLFQSQDEIDKAPKSRFHSVVRPGDVKYKDVNGDGFIDSYDEVRMGYPRNPNITYGFGGTVALKGFDASVYFTGAAQATTFLDGWTAMPFWEGEGANNVLQDYYDNRWTPGNHNGKYPAIDVGNNPHNYKRSTIYMRDASFLRLKTAEIGYTLPKKLIGRYGLSNLRFFANGTNLITWDKVKIIDPESNGGVVGEYPQQRILNVGLQIDFK